MKKRGELKGKVDVKSGPWKIWHKDKPLSVADIPSVRSIQISEEFNMPSMFTIRLSAGNFKGGTWKGVDFKQYKIGDKIEIALGDVKKPAMLSGKISRIDVAIVDGPEITLLGFDLLNDLRFGKHSRHYLGKTDSDIVKLIAAEDKLKPGAVGTQLEITKTKYENLYQNNVSNFDFLAERAKRLGFEFKVEEGALVFRSPKEKAKPVDLIKYGAGLVSFNASVSALDEGGVVEVRGWDPIAKKEVTGKAEAGSEFSGGVSASKSGVGVTKSGFQKTNVIVYAEQVTDQKEAKALATGLYNRDLRDFMDCSGESTGNHLIRSGKILELGSLGEVLSGKYFIKACDHTYDIDGGYKTTFKLRRNSL